MSNRKNKYQQAANDIKARFDQLKLGLEEIYKKNTPRSGSYEILHYDNGVKESMARIEGVLAGIAEGNITVSQTNLFTDMLVIQHQCESGFEHSNSRGGKTRVAIDGKFTKLAIQLVQEVLVAGLAADGQQLVGGFAGRV